MAVYFMQSVDGGPVKIGHSENVKARHRQLEKHYGRKLAILAVQDGGKAEEGTIHKRFAHLRLPGPRRRGQRPEQFRPSSELMTFIGRPLLVGANPNTVEAMDVERDGRPVRLTEEAIRWARIASGYTGESMAEYVSRITLERGREDAERLHAEATKAKPAAKKKGEKT